MSCGKWICHSNCGLIFKICLLFLFSMMGNTCHFF